MPALRLPTVPMMPVSWTVLNWKFFCACLKSSLPPVTGGTLPTFGPGPVPVLLALALVLARAAGVPRFGFGACAGVWRPADFGAGVWLVFGFGLVLAFVFWLAFV
ncbi:hypothetical protein, partial [Amycolatopsis sp. NPDC001370]